MPLILAGLLLASALRADISTPTSMDSLKLPRGARPAAMAGAFSAVADDTQSMFYNPAGLTELREVQLSASHLEWLDGVEDESLGLGMPLFGMGAWGLSSTYLHATDEGRDNEGYQQGTFSVFDFSLAAAFALQLGDNGSAGLQYRIMRQGYDNRDGAQHQFNMGSGFDLGFIYRGFFDRKLALAFTSQNMGSAIALGDIPFAQPWTLKGGLAWHLLSNWVLDIDAEHQPYDLINKYRAGTEYVDDLGDETELAIRAGYLLGPENAAGGLSGITAGLGAHWHAWHIDYAFVPKGDLGQSHLLTLTLGFGQH